MANRDLSATTEGRGVDDGERSGIFRVGVEARIFQMIRHDEEIVSAFYYI
jgi:hypothetical protein